jgi:hypothetical protein
MLKLGPNVVNPNILTTSVGANIFHLLFVKFDKDVDTATKILRECVKLGVDANHVDSLEAAPIHVALRRRQEPAVAACVSINLEYGKEVFNLNVKDRR